MKIVVRLTKKGGCNKMDERQNDEYKKSINMYKQHDESNKYTLPILTLKKYR